MSTAFNFLGKVALITGSSSGNGATTALRFAQSGAQVVVTGRNAANLDEVAKQCVKVSPKSLKPLKVVADIDKEEDMKRLVNETINNFGVIDVLVNNAGVMAASGIRDENYMRVYRSGLNTNLSAAVQLTHLCAEHLAKSKGCVVNVSSVNSMVAGANISMYCMTKSAMDMFTKCMAIELGPLGVRVNSVNPGAVRTTIMEKAGIPKDMADQLWDYYANKYPVGRAGKPEDIADAIMFLASDNSAFTTGTIMNVDGGHLAACVEMKK